MKPNVENLNFVWIGEEFIASADFLGRHISVRCRYDTYQRCWRSDVFLVGDIGLRRIEIRPSELYASTKAGSVHRAMHRAKESILGSGISTIAPLVVSPRRTVRDDEIVSSANSFGTPPVTSAANGSSPTP